VGEGALDKKPHGGGGSKGRDLLNWCRSGLIHFLDWAMAKDDRVVVLGSSHGRHFYGCPKEIYDYMVRECSKEFKIYYYLENGNPSDPGCLPKGGNFNWRTIKTLIKARTLIGSHGTTDFGPWMFSKKKIFINTWHGFPLKAIAFSSKNRNKTAERDAQRLKENVTAFLASSDFEAELFAKSFKIEKERIWVVGQPRNDRLADRVLDAAPPFTKDLPPYQKIVLYCPTFRDDTETWLFPFKDFDLEELNKFLEENKLVILLRAHVNEGNRKYISKGGRIVNFSFDVWPDINAFLPHVDIVVTDYSSIFFDYLLLNRPVIFLPYDLEEYERTRGFMIDEYNKWTPGPKISTFKEFLGALTDILNGKDEFGADRKRVNGLVNAAQTVDTPGKVLKNLRKELSRLKK
jgi:CDP-glycerol glycerophosphotransferase